MRFRTLMVFAVVSMTMLLAAGYSRAEKKSTDIMDHIQKNEPPAKAKMGMELPKPGAEPMLDPRIKWRDAALAKVGAKIDGEMSFVDQDGKTVQLKEYFGKPFFVAFIFTGCPHICPAVNSSLGKAAEAANSKYKDQYRMLSISFDTGKDTPAILKEYAKGFTNDTKFWTFGVAKKAKEMTDAFGFSYEPDAKEGWKHVVMVSAVNKDGVIVKQLFGKNVDSGAFSDVLAAMTGK